MDRGARPLDDDAGPTGDDSGGFDGAVPNDPPLLWVAGDGFRVHLPDEYAEEPIEPVYATVAEMPFKQSVSPGAREQAKLNARRDAED